MTCDHPNADGIDGADIDDPYKVWECGTCHQRYSETGGDLPESEYPMVLAKALHSADHTNMAAFHELTGDKRDAYLSMARVARTHIETADAKELRQRELHHFEEEQKRIEAEAKVEQIRQRLWAELGHFGQERNNANMLREHRDRYQARGVELEALRAALDMAGDDLAEAKAERDRAWAETEKVDADVEALRSTRTAAGILRSAADEFATGERVMERCTRGLVAAWLRDRAHLIESGEKPAPTAEIWISRRRMGGTPCIYGTRIPTETIAGWRDDPEGAREHYPGITVDDVEAAVWWEGRP